MRFNEPKIKHNVHEVTVNEEKEKKREGGDTKTKHTSGRMEDK